MRGRPPRSTRTDTLFPYTRLAKLAGGVAVIKVGGVSETEVKERKDRVDDALHAKRAAGEEGVVPGGGTVLLYASKALHGLNPVKDDQRPGITIVRKAHHAPTSGQGRVGKE